MATENPRKRAALEFKFRPDGSLLLDGKPFELAIDKATVIDEQDLTRRLSMAETAPGIDWPIRPYIEVSAAGVRNIS